MKKFSLVAMISIALLFAFTGCEGNRDTSGAKVLKSDESKTVAPKPNPEVSEANKISQEVAKTVEPSQPSIDRDELDKAPVVTEVVSDDKVASDEKVASVENGNPAKQVTLKFNPAVSGTYKISQETTKTVDFSQPSINKNKLDKTSLITEVTFDQKVDSVDKDGNAKLIVTIKAVKLYSKGKKGVNFDFDSSREADSKDSLAKLIGASYSIVVSPKGKVVAVDAKQALDTVKSREAKSFLRKDIVEKRHSFKAAPETDMDVITENGEWSCVVASPRGSLEPKAFEKKYKVDSVDDAGIAKISMVAAPTSKKPKGGVKGKGLGVMAGIFDSKETFTGDMIFDTKSGSLVKYTETLEDNYVAAEEASEGKVDKGPNVLTMTFVSTYSVEKLK